MKKQYQTPFVTIQRIAPSTLICSSVASISGADGLGISNDGTDDAGIITGNSRSTSIWDDDEDDEF